MDVEIWHNPRCTKSRQTLALLEEKGIAPKVVKYLETPPTQKRLKEVIGLLGIEPIALVRTKEKAWKELGLGKDAPAKELIRAMVEHPKLIERPVVITKKGAALGRPPENVLAVL